MFPGFAAFSSAWEATVLAAAASAIAWHCIGRADPAGLWLVLNQDRVLLTARDGRPADCTLRSVAWFRSLLFLNLRCGVRTRLLILARDALSEPDWRRLRRLLRQLEA